MQFIDLATQQDRIRDKINENIQRVLDHGKYIMGPEVSELEGKLADFVGCEHAVSCSSGTDALLFALMAVDVKPGDVIFTTPFTFIATAEVICLLGAVPVFVDIDKDTFNISPVKLDLAIQSIKARDLGIYPIPNNTLKLSAQPPVLKPKGVIAVDLFGLPANYERLNSISKEHDLFVIQDAAQSFGAEYKEQNSCNQADIGCTSFFPAKPLGCYGDGGMCFTDAVDLADIMQSIRIHGKGDHKYDNIRVGVNGRLDTLQAAVLLAKFDIFPEEIKMRQTVANRYNSLLASNSLVKTPCIPNSMKSAWAQYSVLAKDENIRSALQSKLKENDIPTAVYYPKPLHLQTAFSFLGYQEGDFPVSEDCSRRIFSLPMHPYLKAEDQERIVEVMEKIS